MKLLLISQTVTCFFMTGVIWIIQTIHYPGFIFADRAGFQKFHEFHSSRITPIVGPVMFIELLTAVGLFLVSWEITSRAETLWSSINLALVLGLWALTVFVSVPIHNSLATGFDAQLVEKLTTTNWYRTALWTLRSVFLSILIYRRL